MSIYTCEQCRTTICWRAIDTSVTNPKIPTKLTTERLKVMGAISGRMTEFAREARRVPVRRARVEPEIPVYCKVLNAHLTCNSSKDNCLEDNSSEPYGIISLDIYEVQCHWYGHFRRYHYVSFQDRMCCDSLTIALVNDNMSDLETPETFIKESISST